MQIIKYTFDIPVVARVSHIPAKSRIPIKHVILLPYCLALFDHFRLHPYSFGAFLSSSISIYTLFGLHFIPCHHEVAECTPTIDSVFT